MNPMDHDSPCKLLVAQRLLSVKKTDHSWFFDFDAVSLATESAWRLIQQGRVVVGSEDHEQWFGLAEPLDAARVVLSRAGELGVEAAQVATDSGDLTIQFPGRIHLQLLQLSCGYEAWRLSADDGEWICMGGGRIDRLPRA